MPVKRTVLFDMDNTLYTNEPLERFQIDVLYRFVAERTGMDFETAKREFEAKRKQYSKMVGMDVSRSGMIPKFYASMAEWNRYRDEHISANGYLERDEHLVAVFERLTSQGFGLAVVSNSAQKFVREAMVLLGIDARVVASDLIHEFKPSIDYFVTATRFLGVPPETCISVGDRDSDIYPANVIGIRGIKVRNTQDVYTIDTYIQALDKSGKPNLIV